MRVLMIGPPGSGKGTHGVKLAEHLGVSHIAAGDLLRAEVSAGSPVGRRMKDLMAAGELVPDLVIVALLMPAALRAADDGGYVLDGYPRSVAQAELARDVVDQMELRADLVINLEVPEAELVRRILARAALEGRTDDTPEIIRKRLQVFEDATRPLVEYYTDRGILRSIDAARPIDEVTADVIAVVGSAALELTTPRQA